MQLEQETTESLNQLLRDITTAKDFVVANAPEYFQQLMLMAHVKAGMVLLVFVVFASITLFTIRKSMVDRTCHDSGAVFVSGLVCGLVALFTGIMSIVLVLESITAIVAPKVYIVEHITSLLK